MGKARLTKLRMSAALLLALGLIAGCGAGAGGGTNGSADGSGRPAGSIEPADGVEPAGNVEPSAGAGSEDAAGVDASVMSAPADLAGCIPSDEWQTRAGFSRTTGAWFLAGGGGYLGYGLTAGTKRPGDEIAVSLFAHEADFRLDRDIRIRLTELTEDLEPARVVVDETVHVGPVGSHDVVYTGALPDPENAVYALGAEIIGPDGEPEDAIAALIRVPAAEINASARLDRTVYGDGEETAVLTLENAGPTVLVFGVDYRIEKLEDGEWRDVPLDLAFIDIALMLQPGQSHELQVDLRKLGPGEYRVVKPLWAEGLDLSAELIAVFMIE